MTSLSPKVIRSGFWSLGGNWLSRGLGIVKMIILARLLSPVDFGIIGLAGLSINILNVFSETGIESALIQKQKIDNSHLDAAWTIGVIRGLVLFLILFLSAGWFSVYFDSIALKPVLQVMAVVFILGGVANIGMVFFQKELEFQKKIVLELISDLCGALTSVLSAFWFRNVWAIVLGSIVWGIVRCIGTYRMHAYRPRICWDWPVVRSLLSFGKHIFWISLTTLIVTSGDDAIIGKILGLSLLGYYTMAYNIANVPVSSLAGIIGKISFPAYAKLQKEPARLSDAFRRVYEVQLYILLPVTALIIILAEDFTSIFLGDQWLSMVPVLRILCLLGLFRGLTNIFAPVQLAVNRPQIQSRNKTIELILFLLMVYPFTKTWGLIGAGCAVTAVYLVSCIVNGLSCALLVPGIYRAIIKASWLPGVATLGLILGACSVHSWLVTSGGMLRFLLSGISGAAAFGSIIFIFNKKMLRDVFGGLLEQDEE